MRQPIREGSPTGPRARLPGAYGWGFVQVFHTQRNRARVLQGVPLSLKKQAISKQDRASVPFVSQSENFNGGRGHVFASCIQQTHHQRHRRPLPGRAIAGDARKNWCCTSGFGAAGERRRPITEAGIRALAEYLCSGHWRSAFPLLSVSDFVSIDGGTAGVAEEITEGQFIPIDA